MKRPLEIKFKRGDHTELGLALIAALDKAGRLVFDEGSLYRYSPTEGVWELVGADEQSRIVQSYAGSPVETGRIRVLHINSNTVEGAIACAAQRSQRPGFFSADETPTGLCFQNGFVQIQHGEISLVPHHLEHRQRFGYAFPYKKYTSSKVFEDFMTSLFEGDADGAEKVGFLQELLGSALVGAGTRWQVCGVLVGEGSNGKDTLLDVLSGVFPVGGVTCVPPNRWGAEYNRAALNGKLLNVVGEIPSSELMSSEAFKAITGGTVVEARLPYGRPFTFRPVAGQVFACNRLPKTVDFSHGFFRRFVVVRFNRVFDDATKVVGLASKILETEQPAIVSWLLEGAARALREGGLKKPASHALETARWRGEVDQVAAWFRECCAAPGATYAARLYQHFSGWGEANGHKRMTSTEFGIRLKSVLKIAGLPEPKKRETGLVYPVGLPGSGRVAGANSPASGPAKVLKFPKKDDEL